MEEGIKNVQLFAEYVIYAFSPDIKLHRESREIHVAKDSVYQVLPYFL